MADLVFVAIVIAFFVIAVLWVRLCDAVIGDDPSAPAANEGADRPVDEVAA